MTKVELPTPDELMELTMGVDLPRAMAKLQRQMMRILKDPELNAVLQGVLDGLSAK
ncbi:MAG TPA: hypothetical protein VGC54_03600 [Planctomycetota bacterium]